MDSGVRTTLLGIAAFVSLVLGLFVATMSITRPLSEDDAQRLGVYIFEQPRTIQEFSMLDQDGTAVGIKDLSGSWSLVFFGFTTCPDVCPTTLGVLSEVVKDLPAPPNVIMVTVDPERDTPAKLKQYVPAFNPTFRGFTGTFDETVALAQQLNIAFGKVPGVMPGSYQVDHSASLVLINPAGQYAGFIKAPHNAQNIQRILERL